jgi:uncharacterized protein YbjT (DUF2867 family)
MASQARQPLIAVAGATGSLGSLIALELRKSNIPAIALIRPGTAPSRTAELRTAGVQIIEVDLNNVAALTKALSGVTVLASALQGLSDVMIDVQGALLAASTKAGVTRFIPSDYSLDFTKTVPGTNRNLDLRREFHTKLEESGIQWTSVLNGGFMELLVSRQLPMIIDGWKKVMYFGSKEQKIDFSTIPDVARFTAKVAADPNPTPKVLRIAGASISPIELAETVSRVKGEKYTPMWNGSVGFLRFLIPVFKFLVGGEKTKLLPPWQGMQYLENMVSGAGKLDPLDNNRYPELQWTTVEMALREADATTAGGKKAV